MGVLHRRDLRPGDLSVEGGRHGDRRLRKILIHGHSLYTKGPETVVGEKWGINMCGRDTLTRFWSPPPLNRRRTGSHTDPRRGLSERIKEERRGWERG